MINIVEKNKTSIISGESSGWEGTEHLNQVLRKDAKEKVTFSKGLNAVKESKTQRYLGENPGQGERLGQRS